MASIRQAGTHTPGTGCKWNTYLDKVGVYYRNKDWRITGVPPAAERARLVLCVVGVTIAGYVVRVLQESTMYTPLLLYWTQRNISAARVQKGLHTNKMRRRMT